MKIERIRAVLGVWTPMAIGFLILVTSLNFYFNANLPGDVESWRLVCSAGAIFVGGVLLLSTYGRYAKAKEARREAAVPRSSVPPATTPREPTDEGRENDNKDR